MCWCRSFVCWSCTNIICLFVWLFVWGVRLNLCFVRCQHGWLFWVCAASCLIFLFVVRIISMLVCLFRINAALVYMLVYPVDVSLWLDVLYFLQIEQLRDAERAAVRFADLFCCVTSEFAFYLSTACPDPLPAYLLPLSTCSMLL